jgi:alpha-1,6-mannosyltransferase
VLLAAAARLGRPYHLLLIAAGKDQPPQDNATFLDYVGDPRALTRLISSCDAFVHANANEPFGLVIIEAMACGLPVVGMATGGAAELIDEAVGQPARAPTEAAVAEAVEALFERDLDALGRAARRRAVERHSWDRAFEGLSGALRPAHRRDRVRGRTSGAAQLIRSLPLVGRDRQPRSAPGWVRRAAAVTFLTAYPPWPARAGLSLPTSRRERRPNMTTLSPASR